jgi:hypothetical protein
MKTGHQYVFGLKNDAAQYWDVATGAWRIEEILPSTYMLTVYKSVSTISCVTVSRMLTYLYRN